jgi:hypothetical protein
MKLEDAAAADGRIRLQDLVAIKEWLAAQEKVAITTKA